MNQIVLQSYRPKIMFEETFECMVLCQRNFGGFLGLFTISIQFWNLAWFEFEFQVRAGFGPDLVSSFTTLCVVQGILN